MTKPDNQKNVMAKPVLAILCSHLTAKNINRGASFPL